MIRHMNLALNGCLLMLHLKKAVPFLRRQSYSSYCKIALQLTVAPSLAITWLNWFWLTFQNQNSGRSNRYMTYNAGILCENRGMLNEACMYACMHKQTNKQSNEQINRQTNKGANGCEYV